MNSCVHIQSVLICKAFATHSTLIWFGSCMNVCGALQVVQLTKTSAAYFTNIRLDSSMNQKVLLETVLPRESLFTQIASIFPDIRVRSRMSLKVVQGGIRFPTDFASNSVRCVICYDNLVRKNVHFLIFSIRTDVLSCCFNNDICTINIHTGGIFLAIINRTVQLSVSFFMFVTEPL